MKRRFKAGDKVTLTLRVDARKEGEDELIRTEDVRIIKIYPHHVMVRRKAGFRECFTRWGFVRVAT